MSIAAKIGCMSHTLFEIVVRVGVDSGVRDGVTTSEAQQDIDLEREVKKLRGANEILKLASAFFAQAELDRWLKLEVTSSTSIATFGVEPICRALQVAPLGYRR